jgi:hypothetical protein
LEIRAASRKFTLSLSAFTFPIGFGALAIVAVAPRVVAQAPLARDGLPGIEQTPLLTARAPGTLAAAASLGYGFTEALGDSDAPHHRQVAQLALAYSPLPYLSVGLRSQERYDYHVDGGEGAADDGTILDSRAVLRADAPLTTAVRGGVELGAWLPGSERASTSLSATSFEGRVLATSTTASWRVAGAAGYRRDRSFKAIDAPGELSRGDRSALGLSDFDAVLLAFGAAYELGEWTLKSECSADLLLGSGAPTVSRSPLRVVVGAQRRLGQALSVDVSSQASLSSRPDPQVVSPLIPIEPRVLLYLGLLWRLGPAQGSAVTAAPSPPEQKAAEPVKKALAAPKPSTTAVEVELRDAQGQPQPGMTVTIECGGRQYELRDQGDGKYRLDSLPLGPARLHAEGEGLEPVDRAVTLSDQPERLELGLREALPSGQIRGLVRSFAGKPVRATVRVVPGGKEVATDPTGEFRLDVPPGDYEVVVSASGFVSQRRMVKVNEKGVVVLNADLVKEK